MEDDMTGPNHKFADVHLWAAMEDIPHLYSIAAAKGAKRALEIAIARAERGEPPMFTGSRKNKAAALLRALPTLEREQNAA